MAELTAREMIQIRITRERLSFLGHLAADRLMTAEQSSDGNGCDSIISYIRCPRSCEEEPTD